MKIYRVILHATSYAAYEIIADNENDAIEKAYANSSFNDAECIDWNIGSEEVEVVE